MAASKDKNEQLEILCDGVVDLIERENLAERLEKKNSIRIKIGFDPTAPDIHLGHLVQLKKLKEFQDLGHQVIFLVGDFTAMIGDPTGKNETRPPLNRDEVKENAKTYISQAGKILDIDKVEVRYNSEWSEKLSPQDIIKLMSRYNVARLLEREDFNTRYTSGQSIALHEFFYPLVQGHDSVALQADLELGGTDQKFNLLVGRKIQKDYGQESQVVMTTPLLVGTDGVKKMSKSLNNYIALLDAPKDKFGKIMSISDELMWDYWEILRLCDKAKLQQMRRDSESGKTNPRDIKLDLAAEIVSWIDGAKAATEARESFIAQFSKGNKPDEIPEYDVEVPPAGLPLANLIKLLEMAPSTSEALRLINAGAVSIDDEKIKDKNHMVKKGGKFLLKVGKRKYASVALL